MSSQKQIDANRLNAQKSTGPNTPEGRDAVRFNALRHGLTAKHAVLENENEQEFQEMLEAFEAEHQPTGLPKISWFNKWSWLPGAIENLSRYETRIERSFYRALRELHRLRKNRGAGLQPASPQTKPPAPPQPEHPVHITNFAEQSQSSPKLLTTNRFAQRVSHDFCGPHRAAIVSEQTAFVRLTFSPA